MTDVARRAGVSVGTVSWVLNRPERVAEATRARVEMAMADLGYVRGAPAGGLAAHWRRNNFASRLFHPAATGRYPKKASGGDPVPVPAAPLARRPGSRPGCRNPVGCLLGAHRARPDPARAGLRHTYRSLMEELGTPKKLMDAQMGHEDGSIGARYAHVTAPMVERLIADLTEAWRAALDARLAFNPGSPVAVLDRLLTSRREGAE